MDSPTTLIFGEEEQFECLLIPESCRIGWPATEAVRDQAHGILNPGDNASHEGALLVEERHLFLYETSVLPETYGQLTNLTTYIRKFAHPALVHMMHLLAGHHEELHGHLDNRATLNLAYDKLYQLTSEHLGAVRSGVEANRNFIIQLHDGLTTMDTGIVKYVEEAMKIFRDELNASSASTHSLLEEFARELEMQNEHSHCDLSAPDSVLQEEYELHVAVVERQLIQAFLHVDELECHLLFEPSSATTTLAAKVVQLEKKLAPKASFENTKYLSHCLTVGKTEAKVIKASLESPVLLKEVFSRLMQVEQKYEYIKDGVQGSNSHPTDDEGCKQIKEELKNRVEAV